MKPTILLAFSAACLLAAPSPSSAAAPTTTKVKATKGAKAKPNPGSLDIASIKKLLLDGTPGDWKFVASGGGTLTSGRKVKIGSDYSGHCVTYKKQGSIGGINLGHVGDCSKTQGGKNITFELKTRGPKGGTIRFGDTVAMFVNGNGGKGFVCYGDRKFGINLNWGSHDGDCKKLSGSKNKPATQWRLMPAAGSDDKVGQPVQMTDRFVLHNVVINQPVVKCARIYGAHTWLAGDLKWRKDCMRHELLFTHRELLEKLVDDPKALIRAATPAKFRSYVEKVL